ncbi:MAG: SpoIIIAC/SpoIIIAD family protein [Gemmiger sp.]
MLLVRVAALAMVLCVFSLLVKKDQPAFFLLISLGGAVCLLGMIFQKFGPLFDWFRTLTDSMGSGAFGSLVHVLGIALVCDFAACACKDAGLASVAAAVELCGRGLALLEAMPLLQDLIDYFMRFLQ